MRSHIILDDEPYSTDGTHTTYCGKRVSKTSEEYLWLDWMGNYVLNHKYSWYNNKEAPVCKRCLKNIPALLYLKYTEL